MTDDRLLIAKKLRQLLIEASPLMEEYTASVCPGCADVCCRQKHGRYRERDRVYLRALGLETPPRDETRPPEGPCEMMGPRGCVQPRWMRPFKCTWYFCEPLLKELDERPQRKARRLSALLHEMTDRYDELSEGETVRRE